ncbi:helix-turn-helix transcriptional regulator [Haloechinothrix salitolerans]|uniref:Helix-turn-helix domain-containing protein n=1 Tax=Haloechinothrix salitolerans TaxID=926830 RepID=A0ABW2CBF4_9PSEU
MSPRVRIRVDVLDKIANGAGLRSRYAIAKKLGVSQSTVGRVLDGEQLPGNPFIAATLTAFDVSFDEVFEVGEVGEVADEVAA